MSILRNPNLGARNYPTDPAERKALLAQKKAELGKALSKLRASLEEIKSDRQSKIKSNQ